MRDASRGEIAHCMDAFLEKEGIEMGLIEAVDSVESSVVFEAPDGHQILVAVCKVDVLIFRNTEGIWGYVGKLEGVKRV